MKISRESSWMLKSYFIFRFSRLTKCAAHSGGAVHLERSELSNSRNETIGFLIKETSQADDNRSLRNFFFR